MQTLSNVPFELIRVGDRVKSKITLVEGFVSDKIDIEDAHRKEDNELVVVWDNGNISYQWHFNYRNIWLM